MVAPGRTHAIAGVIAHSRAIVSSANPRVLVIFMIVHIPLTTRNNDTSSNYNVSWPLTMTAVTVITALRLTETTNATHPMKPIERLGEPFASEKHLDSGMHSRVDTSHGAKQRSEFRDSGQSGRCESRHDSTL